MATREVVLLVLPLLVIQLGLLVYSLIDLSREERHVRWFGKVGWVAIILLGNILGSVLYLIAGREEA